MVATETQGVQRRLLWFDPHVEAQTARGWPGYTPKRDHAALALDLEALPALLAGPEDTVVVTRLPSTALIDRWRRAGAPAPRFVTWDTVDQDPARSPTPWGWSPDTLRRAQRLARGGHCAPPPELSVETLRAVYAKTSWLPVLREVVARFAHDPMIAGSDDVGCAYDTVNDCVSAARALAAPGGDAVVAKAPFGTSGRGALRLDLPTPSAPQLGWLRKTLGLQGAVIVEPWRRGRVDLSVLSHTDPAHEGERAGTTEFVTSEGGQYVGTRLAAPELDGRVVTALDHTREQVRDALLGMGYRGPFGIDAFTYASAAGRVLKPLIEVNPRFTMGHVALAWRRAGATSDFASWRLFTARDAKDLGYDDVSSMAIGLEREGAVATNDPSQAKTCVGMLLPHRHKSHGVC